MITSSFGVPRPYGISLQDGGINFALFSKYATAITLCLLDSKTQELRHQFPLDPKNNKTGDVWHIQLQGVPPDLLYAYRINEQLLGDPYSCSLATGHQWNAHAKEYLPVGHAAASPPPFDWQGIRQPGLALGEMIIYEMHVRGFTQHPTSQVAMPGTFLGMIEKIPYLLDLGVNAVELMPIHEFNENEVKLVNPATGQRLLNFWGYSTVNFFCPMQRYATSDAPWAALNEFKTLVRELHRHGIEVILDVVYNHTGEGNQEGYTYSYKGIDNDVYYIMENDCRYFNASGTGNTFNANHPVPLDLIIESLRYWVLECHVDGFRFDLASCLTRGTNGEPLDPAPLISAISEDPILASTKLIAEPWDAVGLYQVGHFYSQTKRWSEWNDKYRDTVRQFIKGTPGSKGIFVSRICGSEDLYYNRSPLSSINFVTAHDGFTLYDLVAYNEKHNWENGEKGHDGHNLSYSWNCGEEGVTTKEAIHSLRKRQMRNFFMVLMISQGIPMLLMGDEYGHTKKGNNNTWCQDNELNWFLWDRLEQGKDFHRFCKLMIQFRKEQPLLKRGTFLKTEDAQWHGEDPFKPNWDCHNQFLAYTLLEPSQQNNLYIAFNAHHEAKKVTLPPPPTNKAWHRIVDTTAPSPNDIFASKDAPVMTSLMHQFAGHSALLLLAK